MHDDQKIFRLDPIKPDLNAIAKAGTIIRQNGIVIFPTRCLYGVGANALEPKAIENVFRLKQRPMDNPILVLIPDKSLLQDLVKTIPDSAKILMEQFWPGGLTLVFEANSRVPGTLSAGSGKIGIRLPSHPVATALVAHLGIPITATSANLSGQPGCNEVNRLDSSIIDAADLILDAGTLKGGIGSTIIDVTQFPVRLIREGEICFKDVQSAMSRR